VETVEAPAREQLAAAYDAYRAACGALRVRHLVSAAAAERVVRARVELCHALIADGWVPPAPVRVLLERDEALLAVPEIEAALLLETA
jgi:hypothetical protein